MSTPRVIPNSPSDTAPSESDFALCEGDGQIPFPDVTQDGEVPLALSPASSFTAENPSLTLLEDSNPFQHVCRKSQAYFFDPHKTYKTRSEMQDTFEQVGLLKEVLGGVCQSYKDNKITAAQIEGNTVSGGLEFVGGLLNGTLTFGLGPTRVEALLKTLTVGMDPTKGSALRQKMAKWVNKTAQKNSQHYKEQVEKELHSLAEEKGIICSLDDWKKLEQEFGPRLMDEGKFWGYAVACAGLLAVVISFLIDEKKKSNPEIEALYQACLGQFNLPQDADAVPQQTLLDLEKQLKAQIGTQQKASDVVASANKEKQSQIPETMDHVGFALGSFLSAAIAFSPLGAGKMNRSYEKIVGGVKGRYRRWNRGNGIKQLDAQAKTQAERILADAILKGKFSICESAEKRDAKQQELRNWADLVKSTSAPVEVPDAVPAEPPASEFPDVVTGKIETYETEATIVAGAMMLLGLVVGLKSGKKKGMPAEEGTVSHLWVRQSRLRFHVRSAAEGNMPRSGPSLIERMRAAQRWRVRGPSQPTPTQFQQPQILQVTPPATGPSVNRNVAP